MLVSVLHHMLFCSYYRIGLGVVQMVQTKEISEDLRRRVVVETVTKPSLKSLDSTNPQSDRLCTNDSRPVALPRSGQPINITPKARCVTVCEVAMDPRVTSNQLKAILTLANVNIHESTIRKRLSNHRVNGKVARRKPLLSKNNILPVCSLLKIIWTKPEGYWINYLWTDETKT